MLSGREPAIEAKANRMTQCTNSGLLWKCEVYARHRCTLIELYQDDLRNLDFSLRTKLGAP